MFREFRVECVLLYKKKNPIARRQPGSRIGVALVVVRLFGCYNFNVYFVLHLFVEV